jgi:murein DD-endopeptidase
MEVRMVQLLALLAVSVTVEPVPRNEVRRSSGFHSVAPTIYRTLPVDISVRERPTAVLLSDGRWHVAYGVFIASWMDRDVRIQSVAVRDANSSVLVALYDSSALANPFRQRATYYVESAASSFANLLLAHGRTAFVSVDFVVPGPGALPLEIQHLVTFAPDSLLAMRRDDGSVSTELIARSEPRATGQPVRVIAAPVRGGPWRCANGLAYDNAHSSLYPYRTSAMRVPQRFGCDFFKVDSAGNTLPNPFPDTIANAMFYGYEQPVVAVADGEITHVTDGVPENVPQADGSTRMPVPLTNETVSGNWIALRIADNTYAFYAHLKPGSIRVRNGQRVRRGEVLGLLGNSGNAVGPHLHFHLGNRNALNESDAVPYVFHTFELLTKESGAFGKQGEHRSGQLLGNGASVRFP